MLYIVPNALLKALWGNEFLYCKVHTWNDRKWALFPIKEFGINCPIKHYAGFRTANCLLQKDVQMLNLMSAMLFYIKLQNIQINIYTLPENNYINIYILWENNQRGIKQVIWQEALWLQSYCNNFSTLWRNFPEVCQR